MSLEDVGMWVSKVPIVPLQVETRHDLMADVREQGVELRVSESLVSLRKLWQTSLHVSGIRLRNARDWMSQDRAIG
jgi:hypothetical protein